MSQTNLFILSVLFIGLIGVGIFLSSGRKSSHSYKKLKINEGYDSNSQAYHEKISNLEDYPRQHPVLKYQRKASYDTHPASYGDQIRPFYPISGPLGEMYQKKSTGFN